MHFLNYKVKNWWFHQLSVCLEVDAMQWPNGATYTGQWKDNKMHGDGTYIDKDGNTWTGQFFNGTGPGLICELKWSKIHLIMYIFVQVVTPLFEWGHAIVKCNQTMLDLIYALAYCGYVCVLMSWASLIVVTYHFNVTPPTFFITTKQ